jgi:hypothetical protein
MPAEQGGNQIAQSVVIYREKQTGSERGSPRYWTVGASVGSSLAAPWLIGTLRGTIAPFNYAFLELGFDYGFISRVPDAGAYYSLYPFAHIAYYRPFGSFGGWYAGAGGGYMRLSYTFPEGAYAENIFTANATAGINLFDMINISYTFRTDFRSGSHRVSAGYTYRFK